MLLGQIKCFQVLHRAPAIVALTLVFSVMVAACGGGGGGAPPKAAELSLATGTIETFNGTGAQARISGPDGVALDSVGNTYITQTGLHSVRKISPAGVVSVFAGDAVNSGAINGAGAAARFSSPGAIAIDKDDNIYVLDTGNYTVRKISSSGQVTTVAGSPGLSGTADGKGVAAQFSNLRSIAVDPTGGVFVWDYKALRKLSADGSVATLAVPLDALRLDVHLACDASGNLFIASGTQRSDLFQRPIPLLHKLTPAGVLTQVYAFSAEVADGTVFNFGGIAVDGAGNIYLSNGVFTVAFTPNISFTSIGNTVLKLSPQGALTTLAGIRGQTGFNDGQGLSARFDEPGKVASDRQGNLVVADVSNGSLRTISGGGTVVTLAGRASASVDGQGDKAQLKAVVGLASDQRGNVVVAEYSALRSLSSSGLLTTTLRDPNARLQNLALDCHGFMYTTHYLGTFSSTYQHAPDGVATGKTYGYAYALAVDTQDNLYGVVGQQFSNMTNGKMQVDVGAGYVPAFAFDAVGNAYLVDRFRSIVLKVSPEGVVSTLAGIDSKPGYKDGAAGTAQFNSPAGIAVLGTDVYVADTGNNLIRKISQDGTVTTIAGTPGSLDTVMGAPGSLYRPTYLATESNTSLLVVTDSKAVVRIRLR